MAQLLRLQLAVIIAVVALAVTATARPSTFLISSYSFSVPSTYSTVTEIQSFIPVYIATFKPSLSGQIFVDHAQEGNAIRIDHHRRAPYGFYAYDFSSFCTRTNDIFSVVVALLFGVGCGALTATTMYFAWSIFSNRYEDYSSSYDHFLDDSDEKIESPKKIGYEKIPASKEARLPLPSGQSEPSMYCPGYPEAENFMLGSKKPVPEYHGEGK
ncbi:unnamed protein product [Lupinus luteus]|uniref:Uncharacterized protein n=1 Tax=Lupinus luteus TaxID=3873 RepID=A0AAV1X813_LUPLU